MRLSVLKNTRLSDDEAKKMHLLTIRAVDDNPAGDNRAPSDPPGRKIQTVELAVFVFLIVPALSTSFLIGNQASGGYGHGLDHPGMPSSNEDA